MSYLSETNRLQRLNEGAGPLLLALLALSLAFAGGLLTAQQPILGLALILAAPLVLTTLLWPDVATLIVVFILYSNAAVVAVRFHNVPYIVGAAFPALLLLPLASYLIIRRQQLIMTPALPLLFVYLGIQLVGALLARSFNLALPSLMTFLLEGLVIYVLVTNAVRTPTMLRQIIWVLLLAGLLLGAVPLYQQLTRSFDNEFGGFGQVAPTGFRTGEETLQGEVRQPRLAGAIGEQNRFAQIMLVLVPLGLFRFWGERSTFLRLLALGITAVISVGVVLAFSRGAAVGFILMLVIMLSLRTIKPYQFGIIILGTILLLLAMPQYNQRLVSIPSAASMFSDEPGGEEPDGAIQGRTVEMLAAVYVFLDHPVIGVGPGMFRYYSAEYGNRLGIRMLQGNRESHSLYLDIAANHGLLGLICFLAIIYITLRDLIRARHRWLEEHPELANMATGLMLGIISYLTTGLFLHLAYARYFWLILALGAAASYVAGIAPKTEPIENQELSLSIDAEHRHE